MAYLGRQRLSNAAARRDVPAIRIDVATAADTGAVLDSAEALVTADAGRFDSDLAWRARFGVALAAARCPDTT